jgi:hypothetical protein
MMEVSERWTDRVALTLVRPEQEASATMIKSGNFQTLMREPNCTEASSSDSVVFARRSARRQISNYIESTLVG